MTRLIDADALKKEFGYTDEWYKSRTVAQIIDEAPTVEDRPKGKWIKEDKPFGSFGDFVLVNTCSICSESFIYHGENANFCPNCGADMREERDNDPN